MSPLSLLLRRFSMFVFFKFHGHLVFTPDDVSIGWYLQADAAHAGRGSDALVEKRRADKMLIARMLDMEEAFMTGKVQNQSLFKNCNFSVRDRTRLVLV